jgi:integrase
MTVRTLLSAAKVRTARPAENGRPKLYGDGGGLYLHVHRSKDGEEVHRSWLYRFVSPTVGRTRAMGLGSVDDCSLAEARERALELRRQVRNGIDPIEERDQARADRVREDVTKAKSKGRLFESVAEQTIAAMRPQWSEKGGSEEQWRQSLRDYASPILGKMPVDAIETADVLRVIEPLWTAKRTTAERVRNRIEKVLDRAGAMRMRTGENPARWKGHLEHLLAREERREDEHHKALPYAEMPGFMAKLRTEDSTVARALEFCILTNARPGEVIGNNHWKVPMAWGEVDLEAGLWTVPGSGPRKHKSGHIWRCPLSDRAVEILTVLKPAEADPAAPCSLGCRSKRRCGSCASWRVTLRSRCTAATAAASPTGPPKSTPASPRKLASSLSATGSATRWIRLTAAAMHWPAAAGWRSYGRIIARVGSRRRWSI